jgi:hypothetical protein
MPTLSRFLGVSITMNWDDHQPPHFHARYSEHEAIIRVDTLEVEAGRLPKRILGKVLGWAVAHHDELWVNWDRVQSRQPVHPIAPLK